MRTIRILLTIFLLAPLPVFAQTVHIPDPNLRAAISEELDGAPVTRETMLQLTKLNARERGVTDLTGLGYAHNLKSLTLVYNNISDLTPISDLRLDDLWLWDNLVADLSPLANMTTLTYLDLGYNRISDISPLEKLTRLKWLELQGNQITDVTPLAGLTSLENLWITDNRITDYSSIDNLSLSVFEYDQICDMPPLPLEPRLERSFPSIFAAWGGLGWSPVINQPHLSDLEQMSQHDLYFCCLIFGGKFVETNDGVVIQGGLNKAIQGRDNYIVQNPDMIFLAAFSWFIDDLSTYPPDSPYWQRDADGEIVINYDAGTVDITHPDVQQAIIGKAIAIDKCGLYDGVFFDFWGEYGHSAENVDAMLAIVKGIREVTRENFLIMGNSNSRSAPKTGPYINGLFMETGVPFHEYNYGGNEQVEAELTQIETTLRWGAGNLRSPHIIGLETVGFTDDGEPLDSPRNLRWMRAMTALSLTFSDGYALYVTRYLDGEHMHWHYWYDFWDADLGRPVGPKSQLYDEDIPGLYIREYTNGWAVYNHSGKPQIITLPEKAQGVASGWLNTQHALPNLDGEMYLRVKPKNPADVNRDGIVNILDLTLIAQAFGTDSRNADINADGVVNVFDLVIVAKQF